MSNLKQAMLQAKQDMGGMTPVSKEEMKWIKELTFCHDKLAEGEAKR